MTGSPPEDCATAAMPQGGGPGVRIVVCSSCRLPGSDSENPRPGALLAAAVKHAAETSGIPVSQVSCLANCKRSLSAAILRTGGWSYVFGDLGAANAEDLVAGARLLEDAPDGLLPWRGRPEALKRGLVARLPPLSSLEEIPA